MGGVRKRQILEEDALVAAVTKGGSCPREEPWAETWERREDDAEPSLRGAEEASGED